MEGECILRTKRENSADRERDSFFIPSIDIEILSDCLLSQEVNSVLSILPNRLRPLIDYIFDILLPGTAKSEQILTKKALNLLYNGLRSLSFEEMHHAIGATQLDRGEDKVFSPAIFTDVMLSKASKGMIVFEPVHLVGKNGLPSSSSLARWSNFARHEHCQLRIERLVLDGDTELAQDCLRYISAAFAISKGGASAGQ